MSAAPDTPALSVEALKPCPFCGSRDIDPAEWLRNDGVSGPGCEACGASASSAEDWNRRAALSVEERMAGVEAELRRLAWSAAYDSKLCFETDRHAEGCVYLAKQNANAGAADLIRAALSSGASA